MLYDSSKIKNLGFHEININGRNLLCQVDVTFFRLGYELVDRNIIANVVDDKGEVREVWGRWWEDKEWIRLL